MTLFPHNRQPSYVESSSCLDEYRSRSESTSLGQPCCTYCKTRESFGSLAVQVRMSQAETGDSAKCSVRRTNSGARSVVVGVTGSGNLLNASAFP